MPKAIDFFGVELAVGDYVIRATSIGSSAMSVELCRVVSFGPWKDGGTPRPGIVLAYNPSWGGVRHTGLVKFPDRLVRLPEDCVPPKKRFDI